MPDTTIRSLNDVLSQLSSTYEHVYNIVLPVLLSESGTNAEEQANLSSLLDQVLVFGYIEAFLGGLLPSGMIANEDLQDTLREGLSNLTIANAYIQSVVGNENLIADGFDVVRLMRIRRWTEEQMSRLNSLSVALRLISSALERVRGIVNQFPNPPENERLPDGRLPDGVL